MYVYSTIGLMTSSGIDTCGGCSATNRTARGDVFGLQNFPRCFVADRRRAELEDRRVDFAGIDVADADAAVLLFRGRPMPSAVMPNFDGGVGDAAQRRAHLPATQLMLMMTPSLRSIIAGDGEWMQ